MHISFDKIILGNKTKRTVLLVLVTIFPILLGFAILWLRGTNYPLYEVVGTEDHIVEWLQFCLFGASGVVALILSSRLRKVSKPFFLLFLILSVGLLFIAGEEISWGERLFNLQSPGIFDGQTQIPFLQNNVQSEMNLHNFKAIHSRVGYIYAAISIYACFGWLVVCIFGKIVEIRKDVKNFVRFLIIPPYLSLYFLPLILNISPSITIYMSPQDHEMVEFIFSLGVFLFLFLSSIYFKNRFEKESNIN